MRLLFKLLRRNLNLWQMLGFSIANLLGAVIVLFGIQAYRDLDAVFGAEDSFLSSNYLVLSKPVNVLSTITSSLGVHPGFDEEEIQALEQAASRPESSADGTPPAASPHSGHWLLSSQTSER